MKKDKFLTIKEEKELKEKLRKLKIKKSHLLNKSILNKSSLEEEYYSIQNEINQIEEKIEINNKKLLNSAMGE